MNERIKELADEADGVFIHKLITGAKQYTFLEKDLEKFARLIVRECRQVSLKNSHRNDDMGAIIARQIREHFGVEE